MTGGRRKRHAGTDAPAADKSVLVHPTPASESNNRSNTSVLWVSLGLAIITVLVFAPVRHFDFVNFDDPQYVSQNPNIASGLTWSGIVWAFTTGYASNWHPVTWLSHMADVQLFGLNAGSHHATSLLLHLLNVLLLFWVLLRLTGKQIESGFIAALFAVHPLHVESVAWVSERKDVLSTFFLLITLWAYFEYVRKPTRRRYLAVFVVLAVGLMAKPMLITVPFILLLLDFWPLRRITVNVRSCLGSLIKEKLPLLGLVIISSIVTVIVQAGGGSVSSVSAMPLRLRFANALVSYIEYITKMLWPARLAAFYPYPLERHAGLVISALLVLIGISFIAIKTIRTRPYVAVGWFWYLGTLFPVIGLVQVGTQSMADRYTYVPLIGLFIIVVWGLADLFAASSNRHLVLSILGVLVVIPCMITARAQVRYWSNSPTLWQHAVDVTANNYVAHTNLGAALRQVRPDEAATHFQEALRLKPAYMALGLYPDFAPAHNNLGFILASQGKADQAMAQYSEALRLKPDFAEAHNNLGSILTSIGRNDEATSHYAEALRLNPDYAEAHLNLAFALETAGKPDEAAAHYRRALQLKSGYSEAHNNLGLLLVNQGRIDEGIEHLSQALRLKPEYAEAHNNLGLSLIRSGRSAEAIPHLSEAVRLKPGSANAHNNLANVFADQGRIGEAMSEYSEALKLEPNYAEAHGNLGVLLLQEGRVNDGIAHLSEALRLNPELIDAHNNLGLLYIKQGKIEEAKHHFSEVLRINPQHPGARKMLEDLMKQTRKPASHAIGR